MVVPVPEDVGEEEATPQPSEDSDSNKSYEAQEDMTISPGDIEVVVGVAHAAEAFSGLCSKCNKVGHQFHDEECEMFDLKF